MSEPQSRLPHRLSVVWFSDLVGWSDLAARDEDRAIALAVQVGQDPVFEPLRSDPRFDAILHRIGLT